MKKIYFLTLFTGMILFAARAQSSFDVLDPNGAVINNDTFTITGPASASVMVEHFKLKNNSSSKKFVSVKRYEISVQPNTQNYFCWSVCYLPVNAGQYPYFEDNGVIEVLSNAVEDTTLDCYYKPQNVNGSSYFRYVFFDRQNPGDSVQFFVKFATWATNIQDQKNNGITIYPTNTNGSIFIENSLGIRQVLIFDLTGKMVHSQNFSYESKVNLDLTHLPSSLYFVRVIDANGTATARKIVKN
ncbi:MAG: hypothetical protein KatS3mg034_1369 [Vicingaceae bacterium]|nr:MAG: hypothetical protein KatS3mg034_1369 [Vicingaceae bacterium]